MPKQMTAVNDPVMKTLILNPTLILDPTRILILDPTRILILDPTPDQTVNTVSTAGITDMIVTQTQTLVGRNALEQS